MPSLTRIYQLPDGHRVTVQVRIPDNTERHFAITGTLPDGTSGAVGDRLAAQIPELQIFEDLHLSDEDGVPMHAAANARYFHEQARGLKESTVDDWRLDETGLTPEQYNRKLACDTLRVERLPDHLDAFAADVLAAQRRRGPNILVDAATRAERKAQREREAAAKYAHAFDTFVSEQRPRWKMEADQARATFASMADDARGAEADDVYNSDGSPHVGPDGPESDRNDIFGIIDEYDLGDRLTGGDRFDSRNMIDAQAEARDRADDPDEDLTDDERADLRRLVTLIDELAGETHDEWHHGLTFIPEGEWDDYAKEFAGDIGAINTDAGWPGSHIDWKAAAAELAQDYSTVTIEDVEYYYR